MSTNTKPNPQTDAVAPSGENLTEEAAGIVEQFPEDVEAPTVEEIVERLDQLTNQYNVPVDEARRATTNHYREVLGLEYDDLAIPGRSSNPVELASINAEGKWIDFTAKVTQLWDPTHDSIAQVGLIGDESGTIKFTKWKKGELPTLEEGEVYQFDNAVTSEYQGRYSVNLNSRSSFKQLDTDIEVSDNATELTAAMVDIQSGSGLIKRCPDEDCTRVLQKSRCSEHGEVDGEFDMRIKAVFDDGTDVQHAIFDKEATEALTGLSMEEAKQQAMDALDTSVVAQDFITDLVGRYYTVEGPVVGKYLLVNDATQLE